MWSSNLARTLKGIRTYSQRFWHRWVSQLNRKASAPPGTDQHLQKDVTSQPCAQGTSTSHKQVQSSTLPRPFSESNPSFEPPTHHQQFQADPEGINRSIIQLLIYRHLSRRIKPKLNRTGAIVFKTLESIPKPPRVGLRMKNSSFN